MISSACASEPATTSPTLIPRQRMVVSPMSTDAAVDASTRSAIRAATSSAMSRGVDATMTNSSPPTRATRSSARLDALSRAAKVASRRSPTAWPNVSLTALNPSRSMNATTTASPDLRAADSMRVISWNNRRRLGKPVSGSVSAAASMAAYADWSSSSSRSRSTCWPIIRENIARMRWASSGSGCFEELAAHSVPYRSPRSVRTGVLTYVVMPSSRAASESPQQVPTSSVNIRPSSSARLQRVSSHGTCRPSGICRSLVLRENRMCWKPCSTSIVVRYVDSSPVTASRISSIGRVRSSSVFAPETESASFSKICSMECR